MGKKKERILELEREVIEWKAACARNDAAAQARFDADKARIVELENERLRFYYANGNFEQLDSAEAVVQRRIDCAVVIEDFSDLLSSAYAIALRRGRTTAWERYIERLVKAGISPVTAKTFKTLDGE
jgi:hypothetical protein